MKAKVIKTGEIVDVYHESQHGQVSNIYKESVLVNGRMWSEDELDFCVKANAPEKIWIDPATDLPKLSGHIDKDSVEYVRADAFIEKACEWIKESITNNPNANSVLVRNGCVTLGMLVEDFKKYMKGE